MKLGGSILSDIDDQLEFGDIAIINNNINSEQSRLRTFFNVPINRCETPFEFSKNENGQSNLKINTHIGYYTTLINKEIMQNINDDICENVDCIDIDGYIIISADDIGKNIAKTIIGGQLSITSNVISDVELSTTSRTVSNMLVPMIYINFDNEECDRNICNVSFEIDNTKCPGWLVFRNDIPKFDNVRSKTVERLYITNPLNKSSKIIENEVWNKLFEFGHNVEYTFEGVTNTKKIIGMKSFSGITNNPNFKSFEFSEFPYRLKKGVKLNDILDVSQFESLHAIDIECKNFGVYIYKKEIEPNKIEALRYDMMTPNYDDCETIARNLPCTEDGWSVILYRF